MDINVKLTSVGVDTGPTLEVKYWDTDTSTFVILNASEAKSSLVALPGVDYNGIPTTATYVRITSIGNCINYIDITISSTTTTTTSTSTSTTTTTTSTSTSTSTTTSTSTSTTTTTELPSCGISATADEF